MRIASGLTTWQSQQQPSTQTAVWSRKQASADAASSRMQTDSVSISDAARKLACQSIETGKQSEIAIENRYTLPASIGEDNGVKGTGLRKYLNIGSGTGDTSLMAMNLNRKNLGSRIDSILKAAGINLAKDEKIIVSVDGKNKIVVGGVKDKAKAEAIAKALNDDERLGRELRKHVATGKIADFADNKKNYTKQMGEFGIDPETTLGEDVDDLFSNPGMRALVIEEYLQENAGLGLTELSLEKGADGSTAILGMNSELNALLAEDGELAATIADMLEKGETAPNFKVSFEFANGAISDATTDKAAKKKIEAVKDELFGRIDEDGNQHANLLGNLHDLLAEAGGDIVDNETTRRIGVGLKILVASDGTYEVAGADKMDRKIVDTIRRAIDMALEIYAEGGAPDRYTGGAKVASLADVAQTFLEQHRFEHGDIDQYQHAVEIDLAGGPNAVKVVSPEADKAQDEANQKVADKLGEKLTEMLDQEGLDTEGLEFEINEQGKITVLGDAENANVKKAQTLIDAFVVETKNQGKAAAEDVDKEEKNKVEKERRAMKSGEKDDSEVNHVPDGFGKHDVVAASTDNAEEREYQALSAKCYERIGRFLPDPEMKDDRSLRIFQTYVGWQRIMPKTWDKAHTLAGADSVSNIRASQYASPAKEGEASGGRYSDDAAGLYLELLDGMGKFHDGRKKMTYRFAA